MAAARAVHATTQGGAPLRQRPVGAWPSRRRPPGQAAHPPRADPTHDDSYSYTYSYSDDDDESNSATLFTGVSADVPHRHHHRHRTAKPVIPVDAPHCSRAAELQDDLEARARGDGDSGGVRRTQSAAVGALESVISGVVGGVGAAVVAGRQAVRMPSRRLTRSQSLLGVRQRRVNDKVVNLFARGVFDRAQRQKNLRAFLLGLVGVLLMVVELEVAWDADEARFESSWTTESLKMAMSVSTLLLLVQLWDVYAHSMRVESKRYHLLSSRLLWTRPLTLAQFLAEMCVCAVHPLPFVTEGDSDLVGLLMMLRLYLIVRCVNDRTAIYRNRRIVRAWLDDVSSATVIFGWRLSFKSLFYLHSMYIMVGLSVLVYFTTTFVIRQLERELFASLSDALWFTAVTITTVGYGDITPDSNRGRASACVAAIIGIIVTSILIAVLSNKLQLSSTQKLAVDWLNSNALTVEQRHLAATLIQREWRFTRFRKQRQREMTHMQRRQLMDTHFAGLMLLVKQLRRIRERKGTFQRVDGSSVQTVMSIDQRVAQIEADQHQIIQDFAVFRSEMMGKVGRIERMLERVLQATGATPVSPSPSRAPASRAPQSGDTSRKGKRRRRR